MPASSRAKGDGLCRRDPRIGRAAVEADQRRARPDHRRYARRDAREGAGRHCRAVPRGGRNGASRGRRRRRRSSTLEIADSSRPRFRRCAAAARIGRACASATPSPTPTARGESRLTRRRRRGASGDPDRRQWHRHCRRKICRGSSTASTGSPKPAFAARRRFGLGLPLTRQFIEAHGGTVELESNEGKGTTVTLTIPRGAR